MIDSVGEEDGPSTLEVQEREVRELQEELEKYGGLLTSSYVQDLIVAADGDIPRALAAAVDGKDGLKDLQGAAEGSASASLEEVMRKNNNERPNCHFCQLPIFKQQHRVEVAATEVPAAGGATGGATAASASPPAGAAAAAGGAGAAQPAEASPAGAGRKRYAHSDKGQCMDAAEYLYALDRVLGARSKLSLKFSNADAEQALIDNGWDIDLAVEALRCREQAAAGAAATVLVP